MSYPNKEALKEVGRWLVLYIISLVLTWFIAETLKQIVAVPESFHLKVWVFTYTIPLRQIFATGLTLTGRYLDKWLHEKNKLEKPHPPGKSMGLLKF